MSHSNIAQTSHQECFLSICPGIWKSHIYTDQSGLFCQQRSEENHKHSQTRFSFGVQRSLPGKHVFDNQKFKEMASICSRRVVRY